MCLLLYFSNQNSIVYLSLMVGTGLLHLRSWIIGILFTCCSFGPWFPPAGCWKDLFNQLLIQLRSLATKPFHLNRFWTASTPVFNQSIVTINGLLDLKQLRTSVLDVHWRPQEGKTHLLSCWKLYCGLNTS